MILFQFKFPDKITNLSKKIDEKTALKLINGYKKLTSGRKPRKANENFLNYREIVKSKNIFNYEFIFVSFSDGKFKKENLVKIINIRKDIISSVPKMSPSSATKNSNIFEQVQKMCQTQKDS